MKKKIIIIFVVLAATFFCYYILQGSRFRKTVTFETKKGQPTDNPKNTPDNNAAQSGEDSAEIAPSIEVQPADCDKDCTRFAKKNEKEYCQEICGTKTFFEDAEESGGSSDDCASEKGIQKDYCLKDIAVGNKDYKTCNEIKDANIKKSCQNRITEDILESQPSQMPNDL